MTQLIRIRKPADPLSDMIDRNRSRYARRWRVAAPFAVETDERAPEPSVAERGIAAKRLAVFNANVVRRG